MKKTLCTSICIAMLGCAGAAGAAPINFYDVKEGAVFDFDAGLIEQTWIFDLNQDSLLSNWDGHGMDPYGSSVDINSEDKILNAWIEINFYEDDYNLNKNGVEKVAFRENAALIVDGNTLFANREIDTGFVHRNIGLSFLYDHLLELTISSTRGNFEVYNLFVGGTFQNNAPVPEPSTILLFGSGLLGLAAVGRKKVNRRVGVNK